MLFSSFSLHIYYKEYEEIDMPGYKGHLLGGACAFALVLYLFQDQCESAVTALQWLLCSLAGALFPDIDVKSKGQKYFYWIVLTVLIVLLGMQEYKLLAVCGIASITPMLSKHRGIFHEAWFIAALSAAAWLFISYLYPTQIEAFFYCALFFMIGAFSHLYLDRGWRGLWPKKKFKKF